jgi:hypothetical protein
LFGKLASPITFKCRLYQECLYDIGVTHYPRYKIDMDLSEGETIFDKIQIPYNKLRSMSNPIEPIADYYRGQLKDGESLWWLDSGENIEKSQDIVIKIINKMDRNAKDSIIVQGIVRFPEIFGNRVDKYSALSFWLLEKGMISSSVRDFYSAGGTEKIRIEDRVYEKVPQMLYKVYIFKNEIRYALSRLNVEQNEAQSEKDEKNSLVQWIDSVVDMSRYSKTQSLLYDVFKT